jgi:LSD1 subclass zinc finger protein
MEEIRCKSCNKLLGYIQGVYEIKCPRCGEMNTKKESVDNDMQKMQRKNGSEF